MKPRFEVKGASHYRKYQTNEEIGKTTIEHYATWLPNRSCWKQICDVQGPIVADMVTEILKIKDVNDVFVKPYEVTVHLKLEKSWLDSRWKEKIDPIVRKAVDQHSKHPVKRVVIQERSDITRSYHTNFEISLGAIESFWRPLRDSSGSFLKKIGYFGEKLVRRIISLPGVIEIVIQPYEITIKIGEAFSWDEGDDGITLENQIENIIQEVMNFEICFSNK